MKSILSEHDKVCILVGSGNNGGIKYVIARMLLNEQMKKGMHGIKGIFL
ncbi:NAD(P)H-hydrate epimerase [Virgibacillus necropolis]|uniref:YjeF N-terminal domain-containing protein n=1 Tax=Virgibacillus necropolis TaxID=163877 RepID=A0A221MHI6_9BACI|nr:NAD(P)H-hydrate epimerase [Virgibacillus necropolis]ASN07090.1 hypothetical protein CFK40_19845 [Virgibacillus necropolis]